MSSSDYTADDLEAIETLDVGEAPKDEWFLAEGEFDEEYFDPGSRYPKCPNPTKWKQVGVSVKTQGRWVPVSSAIYAKAAPVRHTFTVQREVTWGVAIEESFKGSLKLIEAELKIRLDTTTRVSRAESLSYTVPKGEVMALFSAPGYVVRRFERKVWGSAMCNEVIQRSKISSPYTHFLKVDRVT